MRDQESGARVGLQIARVLGEMADDVRIGQKLGYKLGKVGALPYEMLAKAMEGDDASYKEIERLMTEGGAGQAERSDYQRPSMAQDMEKGRRTEIEFLNGLVVREGEKVGLPCRANAVLVDIVKRVEKGELKPDPRHITELRLN